MTRTCERCGEQFETEYAICDNCYAELMYEDELYDIQEPTMEMLEDGRGVHWG